MAGDHSPGHTSGDPAWWALDPTSKGHGHRLVVSPPSDGVDQGDVADQTDPAPFTCRQSPMLPQRHQVAKAKRAPSNAKCTKSAGSPGLR